jgi:hypothetical protein
MPAAITSPFALPAERLGQHPADHEADQQHQLQQVGRLGGGHAAPFAADHQHPGRGHAQDEGREGQQLDRL